MPCRGIRVPTGPQRFSSQRGNFRKVALTTKDGDLPTVMQARISRLQGTARCSRLQKSHILKCLTMNRFLMKCYRYCFLSLMVASTFATLDLEFITRGGLIAIPVSLDLHALKATFPDNWQAIPTIYKPYCWCFKATKKAITADEAQQIDDKMLKCCEEAGILECNPQTLITFYRELRARSIKKCKELPGNHQRVVQALEKAKNSAELATVLEKCGYFVTNKQRQVQQRATSAGLAAETA